MSTLSWGPKQQSFVEKLKGLSSSTFGLDGYPASYCDHVLSSLPYYCTIYKYVINIALDEVKKPIDQLSILDYGAGNGFLGMFAKHYGFRKVWMCDTSGVFLDAAKKTSSTLNVHIDDYILGDISSVNTFFKEKETRPDVILSTDVIEHIYDIESFFHQLKDLNPRLACVFTTASNPHNFYKARQLHKLQHIDEKIGHKSLYGQELKDEGLSSLSFCEQRKQIIKEKFPFLSDTIVEELAQSTRGMRKNNIIESVNLFLKQGVKIVPPEDRHWVCDPETGSWTERILPVDIYQELFKQNGFSFSVNNGFYNQYSEKRLKGLVLKVLNLQILNFQSLGRYIAPFIVFSGISSGKVLK